MDNYKIDTLSARAGINSDEQHGAVIPAIHLSSTFSHKCFNEKREHDYSRTSNPTRSLLGKALSELEGGCHGVVTSSGMSALHLICQLLTPKDTVVIPHDIYGGSYRLFKQLASKGNFKLVIVNQHDDSKLQEALALKPKLVVVESPSNPLLRIIDIEKICKKCKNTGAIVAVDNTFLTPIFQKPLDLGADIAIHSTTKYINGHSDVVGGIIVVKNKELGEELSWWANCIGVGGSSFDSFLILRGLKTLPMRMNQHQANAEMVARFLERREEVEALYFPGLESHPGHDIAKRQQKGFGGVVSFELKGGPEAVGLFMRELRIFTLAQSLGGVESLVCHPQTMTHAGMDRNSQIRAGISQSLVRLSVGVEHIDDIIRDLDRALKVSSGNTVSVLS